MPDKTGGLEENEEPDVEGTAVDVIGDESGAEDRPGGRTADEEPAAAGDSGETAGEVDVRDELEQQLAAKHDRLLRTAAELDNVRKRARRDVEDALAKGRAEVLGELLPALDSLDIALSSATPTAETAALIEGMELVRRQFLTNMERFGLEPIEAEGRAFDPALHEAVSQRPSNEVDAGGVLEDMRRGYMLGERLLRASMVVVSTGSPGADETTAAESSSGGQADQS